MDIMKEVLREEAYLISQRRYYHIHPSVTGSEEPTIEDIAKELDTLGIRYVTVPNGGLLGFLEGKGYENSPEDAKIRTVLLRADVDALPVEEMPQNLNQDKVCISENPGVCHACGHDSHIAMLLTAAKILAAHREEIQGRILLMFERGEEGPNNIVYLYRYILDHKIHIDSSYGCHTYAYLDSGLVSLREGPVMAGGVFFAVKITGKGGHGSRPDLSNSPIDCYAAIHHALSEFRMKKLDPFHAFTFAMGFVHSGAVDNVIPQDLTFGGNARLYDLNDGLLFKQYLLDTLNKVCDQYGCSWEEKYIIGPKLPVVNDPEATELAIQAAEKVLGKERLTKAEPWMACETICTTLAKWPGVFALIGSRNPEKGTGAAHHNGAFDVDEDVMKYGSASAIAYALAFLSSDLDTSERANKESFSEIFRKCGYSKEICDFLAGGPNPGLSSRNSR